MATLGDRKWKEIASKGAASVSTLNEIFSADLDFGGFSDDNGRPIMVDPNSPLAEFITYIREKILTIEDK